MKHDDNLNDLLKAWQPPVDLPRNFQSKVWDRIAAEEDNCQPLWWRKAARWLVEGGVRPRIAVPAAAGLLLVALVAGQIQSGVASSREMDRLGTRYALSIDPVAKAQMRQGP